MNDLIKNFGIDWRLLLAQAVNFFILLALLRMFAYKPILRMLKSRKEEIEKGLRFTEEVDKKIQNIELERQKTLQTAKQEALSIVSAAEQMGKKRKEEIIHYAHNKVETIVVDAKRTIEQERAKMNDELYGDTQELVKQGIIKVLGKMPSGERDAFLVTEALEELKKAKKAIHAK